MCVNAQKRGWSKPLAQLEEKRNALGSPFMQRVFTASIHSTEEIMKHLTKLLAMPLALGLMPYSAIAKDDNDDDSREFVAEMVQLNSSGVWAEVELELIDGKTLKVEIKATGLEPGKPHPQHIHGKDNPVADATCPGLDADTDGDGLISVGEGVPSYGPIILPLVPFDLVDAGGNLDYEATFTINPGALQPLNKRTIVMHGLTVNGAYIPSLPIACGQIVEED
jgi:hypothetical protein